MKRIFLSLMVMLMFSVSGAFALSITDDYYLGSISPSDPANPVAETGYVNQLIGMDVNTEFSEPLNPVFTRVYTRSSNNIDPLPEAVFSYKIDSPFASLEFVGVTADYILGKYATISHVWVVSGLNAFFLPGNIDRDLSHYSVFNNTQAVPEPATLLLLGAGLVGMGVYRRKVSI
ncbi:MAG: PEP-CTERM sorting domain-containing protein [Desulfuromonadales bacterium]|nr:PEP-CTERM sorting domain-containing protein [Desulfuromonadales bacterium]